MHARQGGRAGRTAVLVRITASAVALCAVGLTAVALWLYFAAPQSDVVPGRIAHVRIPAGATTREIGDILVKAGVIRNANGFALRSRLAGAEGALRPGTYEIETGLAYGAAIEVLETGPPPPPLTVTIPEGFRIDQIARRLEEEAGIPAREFEALASHGAKRFSADHPLLAGAYGDSLEGYLFPKTYALTRSTTATQAIEMMLDQFDREVGTLDLSVAQRSGLTVQQVVIIASMIERESKLDEERRLVSSVIYNRLRRGMRLKIDATIQYVTRTNRFRLTNANLRLKTPYNTYMYAGLPPGPISNPGLKSLAAAASPAETPFLYYVLTGRDGSHTFTTNLAAFLVAKSVSKRVFGR